MGNYSIYNRFLLQHRKDELMIIIQWFGAWMCLPTGL